jgi:hypothetical protein
VFRAATVAMQRRGKHASTTTEAVFSAWVARRLYNDSYRYNRFQVEYLQRDPASRRRRRKGSLKSETVTDGRKSQGTRTRERLRWQGPAAHTKDKPVLSSERAPHGIKNVAVRRIPCGNKNLVASPGWVLYTKTDWTTDRRS